MARVWDRFLSERDREHLAAGWAKSKPFGLGRSPALIVVDNFDTTVTPVRMSVVDAAAGANPSQCGEEGWDALERTHELLGSVRQTLCPVVHTTITDSLPLGVFASTPAELQRTPMRFHELSRPAEGELVIEKAYASAFFGTSLAARLVLQGVDTVLVCGNSTSGCVRATALDGVQHGFRMAVIEDCTFDRTEASHAMSLFDIHTKYGDVISADEALDYVTGCWPS